MPTIKPKQVLKALMLALPVFLVGVAVFRLLAAKADVVYPDAGTESAFLRGYTLANAMVPGTPFGAGSSGPDSAGRGCAFHQREFRFWFSLPSGNEPAAMSAVRRDLESRLTSKSSQITAASGDQRKGFQFDYAAGQTRGSVIVDPLVFADSAPVAGQGSLRPVERVVELRIQISETWRKASELSCRKL